MYYRGANAALLLYDITNDASFESIRGWLEGLSVHSVSLGVAQPFDRILTGSVYRTKKELFTGPHYLHRRC